MLKSNVELEPNRVWAISKLVMTEKLTKSQVIDLFSIKDDHKRITSVFNFMEKIGLFKIREKEIKEPLELIFEKEIIENREKFAFYLSQQLLKQDTKLVKIIVELMNNFDTRYYQADDYRSILNKLPEDLVADYTINYIRVLRFWIHFFDMGYYTSNQIVIYPLKRLITIFNIFQFHGEMSIDKFLNKINAEAIEFKEAVDNKLNKISTLYSQLLIDLEQLGYLEMSYIGDVQNYYNLTGEIIESKKKVSHIKIKKAI